MTWKNKIKKIWKMIIIIYSIIFSVSIVLLLFNILYSVIINSLNPVISSKEFMFAYLIFSFTLITITLQLESKEKNNLKKLSYFNISKYLLISSISIFLGFFTYLNNNLEVKLKILADIFIIYGIGLFSFQLFHLIILLLFPKLFQILKGEMKK